MTRRRLVATVAAAAVVVVGIAGVVLLVAFGPSYRQSRRIEEPVRTTTSDYTTKRMIRGAVRVEVTFTANERRITTRLGSGTFTLSELDPTLTIVYDRREPLRTMLAEDFDKGRASSTAALVRVGVALLAADALVVLTGFVFGTTAIVRRLRSPAT